MEKIVPIETLTPMLVEPSSGSYNNTYLPPRRSSRTWTGMGCSSSSDATTHTRPVCSTLLRTVSLANTSSFCCTSPWTLIVPTSPRMSVRPARRTWREMIFAARHRSYSRFDSSPVASGCSRSCSMMNRSIVMMDVDVCGMAVGREGDRPRLIRAVDLAAPASQPCQHRGRRMAVMVVRPDADHGFARAELGEPRVGRRAGRAVMPNLEHLHPADQPRETPLDRQPGVGLEQKPRAPVAHPQHHAVLVHVEREREPQAVRAQHLERHAVE